MSTKTDMTKQSTEELVATVAKERETVRAFRFGVTGSTTRNVRAVRTAKKEVARALTELNRRAKVDPKNT
jgi:ribosomal protein L29